MNFDGPESRLTHEAGHAAMSVIVNRTVEMVTFSPDGSGQNEAREEPTFGIPIEGWYTDDALSVRLDNEKRILIAFAGSIAQESEWSRRGNENVRRIVDDIE